MGIFRMEGNKFQIRTITFLFAALACNIASTNAWAQNIIQQEKMSYEKCLKVIETSEKKLSITPKISDVTEKNRIAVFSLSDGSLTITCDGKNELVIVSTKTN